MVKGKRDGWVVEVVHVGGGGDEGEGVVEVVRVRGGGAGGEGSKGTCSLIPRPTSVRQFIWEENGKWVWVRD